MAALSSMAISSLISLRCNKCFCLSSPIGFSRAPFSKPSYKNQTLHSAKLFVLGCLNANSNLEEKGKQNVEEEYRVVTAVRSEYNQIVIVDSAASRFLLLDSTNNVHSLLNKGGQNWTGSYWDEFASLPMIIPDGPIAIYGLGGGTAVRLMLELWPSLQLEGWEIDETLIEKARDFMGLSDLEKPTREGGRLYVHVDDALCPSKNAPGNYAGIIVDLFWSGKVLTQLQEVSTWLELSKRLVPNGRIMVNCGGIDAESDAVNQKTPSESEVSTWTLNPTIKALSEAFPGQVSWKRTPDAQGRNFLALTGNLPDLTIWSNEVPVRLSEAVKQWRLCEHFP